MSNLITTSITTASASAQTIGTAIAADPDFGSDIYCTDDGDDVFTELAGDDPRLVAAWCWRVITTPRGSIPGSPDVGIALQDRLRQPVTSSAIKRWPGELRAELLQNDSIDSVDVTFEPIDGSDRAPGWKVTISGNTQEGGTFDLVGALTAGSAILLELTAQ